VVGVAGIARPRRFFEALRSQGFDVARELSFRDHHWFTPRDLERVARVARQVQAEAVVTTEKDAMRLDAVALARAAGRPVLWLPLQAEVVDADRFAGWLADRLRAAKIRRGLAA
jgi:tetraacyldisaccharide 4'-kinase